MGYWLRWLGGGPAGRRFPCAATPPAGTAGYGPVFIAFLFSPILRTSFSFFSFYKKTEKYWLVRFSISMSQSLYYVIHQSMHLFMSHFSLKKSNFHSIYTTYYARFNSFHIYV